jgi:hypothetical protein
MRSAALRFRKNGAPGQASSRYGQLCNDFDTMIKIALAHHQAQ